MKVIEGKIVARNFRDCFFSCLKFTNSEEYKVFKKFAHYGYLEGEVAPDVIEEPEEPPSFKNQTKVYTDVKKDDRDHNKFNPQKYYRNHDLQATFKNLVKLYPLLNLLPSALIFKLIKHGPEEFTTIFFDDNYVSPYLIWNKEMRNELYNTLDRRMERYSEALRLNIKDYQSNLYLKKLGHNYDNTKLSSIFNIFPKIKVKS